MKRILVLVLSTCFFAQVFAETISLKVDQAEFIDKGKVAKAKVRKNYFGPGIDAVPLKGRRTRKSQLRWKCENVKPGKYYISLELGADKFLEFSESLTYRTQLYLNDKLLKWNAHTEPKRYGKHPKRVSYHAKMIYTEPVEIKKGDILRVVNHWRGGQYMFGPLTLNTSLPKQPVVMLSKSPGEPKKRSMVEVTWGKVKRTDGSVSQACGFYNPGLGTLEFKMTALATDYFGKVLLDRSETIKLNSLESVERVFEFKFGDTGRDRLLLGVVTDDPVRPVLDLAKYYINDRIKGPRPKMSLNGEWEMCFAPGAEIGKQPPVDAKWEKVVIPSSQKTDKFHCAWYRKEFQPSAKITGERVILKFESVLDESWIYLNGKMIHHQRFGTEPFEVDATSAFKPGAKNQLLVAVRDWIAYSPKNRQRVLDGEKVVRKDGMRTPVAYTSYGYIGIYGFVWLEARPNVSVDDVFIVTDSKDKNITLKYRLVNNSKEECEVKLFPEILDKGLPFKKLTETEVKIPAGSKVTVTVKGQCPKATLWEPGKPYLYALRTTLKPDSGASDIYCERFGFRDIFIDGLNFIVNGKPMKIKSQWTRGASAVGVRKRRPYSEEERLQQIYDWQRKCVNEWETELSRTHNTVGVKDVCDIADESGIMLKIENGNFCQQKFTLNKEFWKNAVAGELRMVDAYKNHPSVFMWSAGNENMWSWWYQGEAARTVGNRWQKKICEAITEFDLMRRPVEWEADGDLIGEWNYHSLHYPREMNRNSNIPNSCWWGPLDGKTVVKYSMGPITLGEKPLTVGEAFWPATVNRPFGLSIVLGDEAYQGGSFWRKGWMESSQFFLNGFRDAEFAMIDIYLPLHTIKPQTIILKQEDRAFYGGRSVKRNVNIHNDVPRQAKLTLKWSIEGTPAKGEQVLDMAPTAIKRLALDVPLPKVEKRTALEFKMLLLENNTVIHEEKRSWIVYPPFKLKVPEKLDLAVFDPKGTLCDKLTKLKVPFKKLDRLAKLSASSLIIASEALKTLPEGPWRDNLDAYVKKGGKIFILNQNESPDFVPVKLVMKKTTCTIAYLRAPGHPILANLSEGDLRWWADDHIVCANNYRKPSRGNWLPLIDIGTIDGLLETPLLEEYSGKGSFILCQLLMMDKLEKAPVAGVLLQNTLDYLASGQNFRSPAKTALFAGPKSTLKAVCDHSKLVYDDLTGKIDALGAYHTALVDAASGLDPALSQALKDFAQKGGRVMIFQATPKTKDFLSVLTGLDLKFHPAEKEGFDIQYQVHRRTNLGEMAGISNHDLFWASHRIKKAFQGEGGNHSGVKVEEKERIVDFFCSPTVDDEAKCQRLTRPCALLNVPKGKGSILINQLRLDKPVPELKSRVGRLACLLLTNMDCELRGDRDKGMERKKRLRSYAFSTIDLSPYANRGITENKKAGVAAWTNQGENDARNLPVGKHKFGGVPFYISKNPKAAIVLYSTSANNTNMPKVMKDIKINRLADALFFMHTAGWCGGKPFKYQVNYDDGQTLEIPIVNKQQIIDWWADPANYAESMALGGSFAAWRGDNPMRKGVTITGYEWINPHPDKKIKSVDFMSMEKGRAVPVLVGLTTAVNLPSIGEVVDVIGTSGVKVKLGTQIKDVYYIGTKGLSSKHPYYAKAVAAHKNMVVGKKVTLKNDVVTTNKDGHRVSYLYFGKNTYDTNNLVNAKIIGDGLGKLGNFAGNDRHRMYFDNLGFIAKSSKSGLWNYSE